MIKIENIKDYINDSSFNELIEKIYLATEPICKYYPNHKEWFYNIHLPKCIKDINNYTILFVRNPEDHNEIIGVACLRYENKERKICSLYISENYRNKGIGTKLLEESMNWLKTTKPFITITQDNIKYYEDFIKKYDWELKEIKHGFYNNDYNEYCYNYTITESYEEDKKNTNH